MPEPVQFRELLPWQKATVVLAVAGAGEAGTPDAAVEAASGALEAVQNPPPTERTTP